MLEEMHSYWPEGEHVAEKDCNGQKKNDTEALQHSLEELHEDDNTQGNRSQKEKRAAEHFTRGVLTRGEAAKTQDGELPRGATHEIIETKKGELPKLRRRRFSLV